MVMSRIISTHELSRHDSLATGLWLAIHGEAYDLTDFAPHHPGGPEILLKFGGQDATAEYDQVHSPSLIKDNLPISKYVGHLEKASTNPSQPANAWSSQPPPLESLISTHDFAAVASKFFAPKTYAFVSSAATDCLTHQRNSSTYGKITLRPRVLRDVSSVSLRTTILGQPVSSPIFACPTSLGETVHPEGEKEIGRACKDLNIAQVISTSASFTVSEILDAIDSHKTSGGRKNNPVFFQLYVDRERSKSEALLSKTFSSKPKGHALPVLFLTVDSPVVGKREADERVPIPFSSSQVNPMTNSSAQPDKKGSSLGRITASFLSPSLTWSETIPWLRSQIPKETKLVLKGIQSCCDAKIASETEGVDGIVISNHGGRNLDTSPPSILVLLEIRKHCPEVFEKIEVLIDGGITRGTDIFKALCLGAKGVGIGRGILYGLGSGFGAEGVKKYVGILEDELSTTMRLCGVTCIAGVGGCKGEYVNTKAVDHLIPGREIVDREVLADGIEDDDDDDGENKEAKSLDGEFTGGRGGRKARSTTRSKL